MARLGAGAVQETGEPPDGGSVEGEYLVKTSCHRVGVGLGCVEGGAGANKVSEDFVRFAGTTVGAGFAVIDSMGAGGDELWGWAGGSNEPVVKQSPVIDASPQGNARGQAWDLRLVFVAELEIRRFQLAVDLLRR